MAVVTILLWLTESCYGVAAVLSIAIVAATTYTIVEWNSQCQLLRIRSRMTSSVFLALLALMPSLHSVGRAVVPVFCLLACYFLLFKGYGQYRTQGYTFHAFLFLALGSLVYPPLLLLAPTLLVSCNVQLRLLAFKPFVASILGLMLPYWVYGAAVFLCEYVGYVAPAALHRWTAAGLACPTWQAWRERIDAFPPDYTAVEWWQWAAFACLAVLGLIAVGHFVSTSYNDKIRTRQYFYTMLLQLVPILALTICFPRDAAFTLPLLAFGVTPFVAHYFALSRGGSASFVVWLLVVIVLCAAGRLQLWDQLAGMRIDEWTPQSFNISDLWKYFTN